MLVYFIIFNLFNYFANASQQEAVHPKAGMSGARSLPVVDALISTLENSHWDSEDGACLQSTLKMLNGVKNNTLWAVWVWDSMQLPVGSMFGATSYLGNYDQCLKAPWSSDRRYAGLRTQYCLVKFNSPGEKQTRKLDPFDAAEEYYRTPTKTGRTFNQHFFGACLPDICSSSSVSKLAKHLILLTHLPGDMLVTTTNCDVAGKNLGYTAGFYAFWCFVGFLIMVTTYSTFVNKTNLKSNALATITECFCIEKNYRSLYSVSRDEVRVMHGMRFLTAAIIVTVHEFFYHALCPVINGLDFDKIINSKQGLMLMHVEVIVDTFFAMSGLLIVRGLLLGKQKNVLFTLLKRYLRLVGPYAFCMVYLMTTASQMESGPIWNIATRDEEVVCKKYWWKSLLMVNTDVETLCHVVTWYISCDFQLAVLATCLFCIYRKNRLCGNVAFVMIFVTLSANLGWTVYWRRMDILPFSYKSINLKRNSIDLNYTYSKSHVRAGSYLVGMMMGYVITTYKPANYRKVIGQTWSITIAAISLLTMVVMLNVGAIFSDRAYDAVEVALVVATNRVFWAVGVCALIGVCEYGTLPVIPHLLSWDGFVPLSKLSYCLYLIHPLLIQLYKFNLRAPMLYTPYTMVVYGCGVIVVGCAASLILHLILEAPLINISNKLFSENVKPLTPNGNKQHLNHNNSEVIARNNQQETDKTKLL